jgi:hypothetical protein
MDGDKYHDVSVKTAAFDHVVHTPLILSFMLNSSDSTSFCLHRNNGLSKLDEESIDGHVLQTKAHSA